VRAAGRLADRGSVVGVVLAVGALVPVWRGQLRRDDARIQPECNELARPVELNASLLLLGGVTSVSMLFVIVWHLYRAWNTEFTESGVTQPQLRGNVRVRWSEFTNAEVSAQSGIDLVYPGGKVVVAAGLHKEPEVVEALVLSKVKKA
jgi:hypothetical protein